MDNETTNRTTLEDGLYLRVESSVRNFAFKVPKMDFGLDPGISPEEWFLGLNERGVRSKPNAPAKVDTPTESTRSSKWYRVDSAKPTSDKGRVADVIYEVAAEGGAPDGNPKRAASKVKLFKQHASQVLGDCADNNRPVDAKVADEINKYAVIVHEVKVILLYVNQQNVGRFDRNTGKYYSQKVLRKFYVLSPPNKGVLESFASVLADSETNVNPQGRVVAVRRDKVTPRTGRNARVANFQLVQKPDWSGDETLKKVIDQLQAQLRAERSGERSG